MNRFVSRDFPENLPRAEDRRTGCSKAAEWRFSGNAYRRKELYEATRYRRASIKATWIPECADTEGDVGDSKNVEALGVLFPLMIRESPLAFDASREMRVSSAETSFISASKQSKDLFETSASER